MFKFIKNFTLIEQLIIAVNLNFEIVKVFSMNNNKTFSQC